MALPYYDRSLAHGHDTPQRSHMFSGEPRLGNGNNSLHQASNGSSLSYTSYSPTPGTNSNLPEHNQPLLQWTLNWINNADTRSRKPFLWLKGPSGVRKSDIMRVISNSIIHSGRFPGASFSFAREECSDSRQLFITIAGQLGSSFPSYHTYLTSELNKDPRFSERPIQTQFHRAIVQPFVTRRIDTTIPIIIFIDGLDECRDQQDQCCIIALISFFVQRYPISPILWVISSRPQPHLLTTFSLPTIQPSYETEEIPAVSDEATTTQWYDYHLSLGATGSMRTQYIENPGELISNSQPVVGPSDVQPESNENENPETTSMRNQQNARDCLPLATTEHDQLSNTTNSSLPPSNTFFSQSRDFTINNPTMVSNNYQQTPDTDNRSLKMLLKYTVRGADVDSSERNPPPKCHPDTRVCLRERLREWILNRGCGQKPFFWVKGPAGVGKSAVLQSIAESIFSPPAVKPGAAFFFWRSDSTGGRSDPNRLFTTIAYQLYARYPPYRPYLLSKLNEDPNLPERSMKTQFFYFINQPFVHMKLHTDTQPIVIILDGLDECKGEKAQCEIIELISTFVSDHPIAPLLWLVSSRPESHIEAMFTRPKILPTYDMDEIKIDSDESCADVERYLRSEFEEIRDRNSHSIPNPHQWPTETQFLMIASYAGGLFAFASTVMKFIDDVDYRDPVTLLNQVIDGIENARRNQQNSERKRNPFADLDALYNLIMSTIPADILPTTKRMLTIILYPGWFSGIDHSWLSNFIQLPMHQMHSSLHKLNSVLRYSLKSKFSLPHIEHKSFVDYLEDESRSGLFSIGRNSASKEYVSCCHQILHEVMDNLDGQFKVDNIKLTTVFDEPDLCFKAKLDMLCHCLDYMHNYGVTDKDDPFVFILRHFIHMFYFSVVPTWSMGIGDKMHFMRKVYHLVREFSEQDPELFRVFMDAREIKMEAIDAFREALFQRSIKHGRNSEDDNTILYKDMTLEQQTWYDSILRDSSECLCGYPDSEEVVHLFSILKQMWADKSRSHYRVGKFLGSGNSGYIFLPGGLSILKEEWYTQWDVLIPYNKE